MIPKYLYHYILVIYLTPYHAPILLFLITVNNTLF